MKYQLFCFYLDHRTAPVQVRERVALTGDGLRLGLHQLKRMLPSNLAEAVILSTCNRLEVYLVVEKMTDARSVFSSFIRDCFDLPADQILGCVVQASNERAVEHLLRVAAGLESMVLGEPQILGQVAQAIAKASNQHCAGILLNHLFTQAVQAGKRARSETDISRYTTSISHATAVFARDRLGGLAEAKVLLIGAGEMATQAALALSQHGAVNFTCLSRTSAHARAVVEPYHGRIAGWLDLPDELTHADLVISAVNAPHVILSVANITPILPMRTNRLILMDIGVPRNIEPAVGDIQGVELFDLDDLQTVVDEHLSLRQAAIPQVEAIIMDEMEQYSIWLHNRNVTPTIVALRRKSENIAAEEVEKTIRSIKDASPEIQTAVSRMGNSIVNKLLHEPTVCLKLHAQMEDSMVYAQTVRTLFALETGDLDGLETD